MPNTIFWFLKWLAAGLGSGWLPKAPGTWGSLFSLLPAWYLFNMFGLNGLCLATITVTLLGFIVCAFLLPQLVAKGESHDPGWIVIDEWAGQWFCLILLYFFFPTVDLLTLFILAFVLFRGFDIIKPYPIKRLEIWGPHWFSIMFDDLIAALMGAGLGCFILWAST